MASSTTISSINPSSAASVPNNGAATTPPLSRVKDIAGTHLNTPTPPVQSTPEIPQDSPDQALKKQCLFLAKRYNELKKGVEKAKSWKDVADIFKGQEFKDLLNEIEK